MSQNLSAKRGHVPRRLNCSRGLLSDLDFAFSHLSRYSCSQMDTNSLSSSSDDRRNISSLLNPSEDMDSTTSSPEAGHAQLSSYPQQPKHISRGHQRPGMALLDRAGTTHQSHLFPPLPPGHPLQGILVQTKPESNSFRLSRASWGGEGPPPEGFDESVQKRRSPNGAEGKKVT